MQRKIVFSILLFLPLQLHAGSDNFAINPPQKFMPIARDSSGDANAQRTPEKKFYALRSDRERMLSGEMRSDRPRVIRVEQSGAVGAVTENNEVVQQPVSVAPSSLSDDAQDYAMESEAIVGLEESIDPVLALFGGDGEEALGSFRETMRGTASTVAGLARHFTWPVPLTVKQYVTSLYGVRKDPFHGKPAFHGGIDIAAASGTSVVATADGEVVDAKTDMNYGRYVTLRHAEGMLTRYGHLASHKVTEGQRVKAGQTIGTLGSSGRSTGPHLDYRVSKNGVKYDPLLVLTVPSSVAMKDGAPVVATRPEQRSRKVASNALPRGPLVIKVR